MSRDAPSGGGDNEWIAKYATDGNPVCGGNNPTSIEARVRSTKEDFSSTGQTVIMDSETGFSCENNQNENSPFNPNCLNYEVRYCCP